MENKKLSKETIMYLISRLGDNMEGRKKLMKMMFLVEHFNLEKNRIEKEKNMGNDFIIYHYGVFSFDVMNNFMELSQSGKITSLMPLKVIQKDEIKLNTELKSRLDSIIEKFGNKTGKQLELETLGMLNLNIETKRNHFGESIISLIK